jgi:hypothetical protein
MQVKIKHSKRLHDLGYEGVQASDSSHVAMHQVAEYFYASDAANRHMTNMTVSDNVS